MALVKFVTDARTVWINPAMVTSLITGIYGKDYGTKAGTAWCDVSFGGNLDADIRLAMPIDDVAATLNCAST